MSDKKNKFFQHINLFVPKGDEQELRKLHRWINFQHAPQFEGDAPPQGKVSPELMEASWRMHRSQSITVEVELQKDGDLKPIAIFHGGKKYLLTPEDP